MNKNVKRIFFVLTLVTLLIAVGSVSAADDSNSTTAVDNRVSDVTVNDNDYVASESVTTTSNNKVNTKTIEKEEKQIKKDSITINGNTYTKIYENQEVNVDDLWLEESTFFNNCTLKGEYFWLEDMKTYINNTISDATIDIAGSDYYFNNTIFNAGITVGPRCTGTIYLYNSTIKKQITISSRGTLNAYLDDNCTIDSNITTSNRTDAKLEIITNNINMIYPFMNSFNAENGKLSNVIIEKNITNNGNLTIDNATINSTITNMGKLVINDNVLFGDNFLYTGEGEIIINDTSKIALFLNTYNGNYTLKNATINNDKTNYANLTIINSTINSKIKNHLEGILILHNTTINNEIINVGIIIIDNTVNIDHIKNYGSIFIDDIPENYSSDHRIFIVTNDTIDMIFNVTNNGKLIELIKEGDTLDFQGTISGIPGLTSLVINKPVNIITSTNDGRIENFSSITYNNGASGSNITGLYTYNTQFYVRNAHNIVFNNISNVVISKGIGWGVGQTSIGHNSTNILVKNSYFYTKDNGGSSTFVFNWADNSTLVNSTIEADGNVGNLVYLTTYNVDIPSGTTANCNNQILNNTIRGPEKSLAICWAIALSGNNNTVDGNTIHYVGTGITGQWGSGITGQGIDDNATSLVNNSNHKIFNNKLYTGTGFTGIKGCILVNNTFYNNSRFRIGDDSLAINNTASNIEVTGKNSIIRNNNITNNQTYTITGNGTNNTIKDNYLKSLDKYADESVNLNKERNTIANNTPKIELIIDTTTFTPGQNTTIQAGIYFDGEIITNITKGKVTFKVDGKTLKDTNGKVIYVKIVNGTATIENYTIPDTWKEGSTMQAIYSGSTQCDKLNSEKTEITINKEAPTFTIDPVEPTTIGDTITLKATITDNNKVINTGKVVFKINGKTVKDENGKVIYAKVVNNEVIVEYTLPDSYKAKDYIITAVLISPDYERLEDSKTLTVN